MLRFVAFSRAREKVAGGRMRAPGIDASFWLRLEQRYYPPAVARHTFKTPRNTVETACATIIDTKMP